MDKDSYLKTKEKKRKQLDETYKERREKAFSTGKKILFVTCPLCGRGRPMQDRWGNKATFKVKPDYFIIQVRYGAGKGSGFFLKEDESLTIKSMKKEYPRLYNELKQNIKKLFNIFK